ncbi:hypothetical protein WMY93_005451 [Mugilogobius chulae]|uniref:Uncharacterized protein n=1 Tax=Mugilogobius chulae TaxID=88201 RepID=A0AAW0PLI3_9GOBI
MLRVLRYMEERSVGQHYWRASIRTSGRKARILRRRRKGERENRGGDGRRERLHWSVTREGKRRERIREERERDKRERDEKEGEKRDRGERRRKREKREREKRGKERKRERERRERGERKRLHMFIKRRVRENRARERERERERESSSASDSIHKGSLFSFSPSVEQSQSKQALRMCKQALRTCKTNSEDV